MQTQFLVNIKVSDIFFLMILRRPLTQETILYHYGLRGLALKWVKMTNRTGINFSSEMERGRVEKEENS